MAVHTSLTVADWHRLNRLLATALELEGVARTAWLEALGDEDQHLRAVLIDLLTQSEATGFASAQPPTTVARMAADALAAMRREQPGDRIGPWQLTRLLAEGGMGAVWVAQRADGVMKRTAALKLPRAEWVDQGLSERIARERAILARLQHPHIAVLYDAGLGAEGRPYLALEYVDGIAIDAYCKGRELSNVIRQFVLVVRAVAYAHAQLIIHRDLKPANVLVTAEGLPKLLDFGISKLIEGDAASVDATALTRLAGRPLTLAYAAPEQVLSLPITVAADVYALGVMLFELLTASRLYRATEPRALEAELLRGDLRKPSEATQDKPRAKALRGDLDAIVLTALKREPAERYQSAAALADDLERYLEDQPVQARPDSRAYRLKKFIARNRLPVAAGSAVVVALIAGAGVALWQASEARDQATRATALNTFVLSLIRQADPNASAQTKAADLAMLNAIEQRIDSEFKGSPDQLLQLRVTVGDAYRNRGEGSAAIRVYHRAVAAAAPKLPETDLMLLTARVRAADPDLIVSSDATEQLDRAIDVLRGKAKHDAGAADLLVDALRFRSLLSNVFGVPAFPDAERRFDELNEALALAVPQLGEGSRAHLRAANALAGLKAWADVQESLAILEQALASARALGDTTSAEYRAGSALFGASLCQAGRRSEGLALLEPALAEVSAMHGESSLQYERLLSSLDACSADPDDNLLTSGDLLIRAHAAAAAREKPPSIALLRRADDVVDRMLHLHDMAAAEQYYRAAVANYPAILDQPLRERLTRDIEAKHVCILALTGRATAALEAAAPLFAAEGLDYARLGSHAGADLRLSACSSFAQRDLGRYDESIATTQAFLDRCLAMHREIRRCAWGVTMLAHFQLDAGRPTDALATLLRLPERDRAFEGPNWLPQLTYGRALLAAGRPAEALEMLRRSYSVWLRMGDSRNIWAAETEYWFGRAWIAVGDVERGRGMVTEAREILAKSPNAAQRKLADQPVP